MLTKWTLLGGLVAATVLTAGTQVEAGNYFNRHQLVRDVEILHHRTEDFYREARYHEGYSHLTKEARHLLSKVDHFCDTARRSGSHRHLQADFQAVSREMKHVQEEFRRAWHRRQDRHVLRAWAAVESAFDQVYFDLYEGHCGFIQYHCPVRKPSLGHHPTHGHHRDRTDIHHGNDNRHNARRPDHRRPNDNRGRNTSPFVQRDSGGVQIQFGNQGRAPVWAQLLNEALK